MWLTQLNEYSAKQTIWNKNFICVMLTNVCLGFSSSSVNTIVSTFASFLGAGVVLVGALTGMYFGVSFAMRPVSGPLMTKLEKRKLMIFSFALGFVANLGYALTSNIALFIVFRILTGIQYSIVGSLSMTVASDSLPPEKLGSGLGIYGVASAIAMAAGPSVGIYLKEFGTHLGGAGFGYMLVFLFSAFCLGLALIPSFLLKLPKRSQAELRRTGAWYKNILAVNALPPAAIMLLVYMSSAVYSAYLYPYAQQLGITGIGAYFTVSAVVLLVARPVSGKLVDAYGTFRMIMIGAVFMAAALVIVSVSRTVLPLLVAAAVSAIGSGTALPAIQAMCIQAVAPVKRAVAANTNYFGLDMGLFLGPLAGSVVYSITRSYATMYLMMVIPVVLAMVVLALTWKGYERNRQKARAEALADVKD